MDDTKVKYVTGKDAPNINTVQKEEDCPNTNVLLKHNGNTKAVSSEEEYAEELNGLVMMT